jgi:hypothetical protein
MPLIDEQRGTCPCGHEVIATDKGHVWVRWSGERWVEIR